MPDQSISKIIQLIKGESSYWLNKSGMIKEQFSWQHDYYVTSVSPRDLLSVRNYIENQELHHKRQTWEEEYNEFVSSLLPPARAGG
jgi:REP element-mobilizing transposase RayT